MVERVPNADGKLREFAQKIFKLLEQHHRQHEAFAMLFRILKLVIFINFLDPEVGQVFDHLDQVSQHHQLLNLIYFFIVFIGQSAWLCIILFHYFFEQPENRFIGLEEKLKVAHEKVILLLFEVQFNYKKTIRRKQKALFVVRDFS